MIERFKNWKTTLIGAVAAALIAVGGVLSQTDSENIDYKTILGAGVAAAVGFVLKDPKKQTDKVEDREQEEGGE